MRYPNGKKLRPGISYREGNRKTWRMPFILFKLNNARIDHSNYHNRNYTQESLSEKSVKLLT